MFFTFEYIETGNQNNIGKATWTQLIESYWHDLIRKPVGGKLYRCLSNHIVRNKKKIIITNHNSGSVQYPKFEIIDSNTVKIVIPSVYYSSVVQVIDSSIIDDDSDDKLEQQLYQLAIHNPTNFEMNFDTYMKKYNFYTDYTEQSYFIIFAHELVHAARFFEGLFRSQEEEEGTIYGLPSNTLVYQGQVITENQIRKEWRLPARVSHDSKPSSNQPRFYDKY